jgi:hypothetical protein
MRRVGLLELPRAFVLAFGALLLLTAAAAAQSTQATSIKGSITAVEQDGFDLAGHHVIIGPNTQIVSARESTASARELRQSIAVGTLVHVEGVFVEGEHTFAAAKVTVQDAPGQKISGVGIIDRVLATGAEPVFRADGYVLHVTPSTELKFTGEVTALSDVGTNIGVRYEGAQGDNGEILLTRADFVKRKMKAPKRDIKTILAQAQAVSFPPGSMIDIDGSFSTEGNDQKRHKPEDRGGTCGWYPLSRDAQLQERVRTIGQELVPQYQRDLPRDDPAKIAFRFYVVEEPDIHTDLGCDGPGNKGLVLIAVDGMARLKNDDQLAAVLADRVAANMMRLHGMQMVDMEYIDAASLAEWGAPIAAGEDLLIGKVVLREVYRQIKGKRGRMALGYMTDAGFDPWQSPEAWKLLEPGRLPKDLSKLKYPWLSEYELEVLNREYKKPAGTAIGQASGSEQPDKN